MDTDRLYTVDDETAEMLAQHLGGSGAGVVMVVALDGFVDAGNAGDLVVEHLLDEMEHRRLVTFDVDELVDHRSRRPAATFEANAFTDYTPHRLVVDLVRDGDGVPFLLLHGLEPDYRWERFTTALLELVRRFDVTTTVTVHGIPMAVPHSRPSTVTASATRPELVAHRSSWFGTVRIPAGYPVLLERRLGESGRDALSLAVHVPHYLSQSRYVPAAVTLLEELQQVTGLVLDVAALAEPAAEALDEVARKVEESTEVAALVGALEQQYDAFAANQDRENLMAGSAPLPSGDEIAAELEQFLSQQGPE